MIGILTAALVWNGRVFVHLPLGEMPWLKNLMRTVRRFGEKLCNGERTVG